MLVCANCGHEIQKVNETMYLHKSISKTLGAGIICVTQDCKQCNCIYPEIKTQTNSQSKTMGENSND